MAAPLVCVIPEMTSTMNVPAQRARAYRKVVIGPSANSWRTRWGVVEWLRLDLMRPREGKTRILDRAGRLLGQLGVAVFEFFAEFDQLLLKSNQPIVNRVGHVNLIHGRIRQAFALGLDDTSRDADDG